MFNPQFGTVTHFNNKPDKMFGFIRPDQRRADGRDVFFHRNAGCQKIKEERSGILEFEFDTWLEREPHKGDRFAYFDVEDRKGPKAYAWGYEQDWQKAEAAIAARPWRECLLSRVVQESDAPPYEGRVLWEGYYPFLLELVSRGEADFLQVPHEWYTKIWCEWKKVQGWERMYNPRDNCLRGSFEISENARQILAGFPSPRFFSPVMTVTA